MPHTKYDDEFKKSIVALYQSGKTQSQISKDYGISISAVSRWIKLYSEVNFSKEKKSVIVGIIENFCNLSV